MKTNIESLEYVDFGFRPSLQKHASSHRGLQQFMALARMITIGLPAPSLNQRKVAVWYGKVPNKYFELPALAVTVEDSRSISQIEPIWFCGVVALSDVEAIKDDPEADELSLPRVIADCCSNGPRNLYETFALLQTIY